MVNITFLTIVFGFLFCAAYNAFSVHGQSASWCKSHAISFRSMSRAVSIRFQLKKYMQRFNLPLESCKGDADRLRQCLVSGYWRNGARWVADGTYRSIRGNKVCCYIYGNTVANLLMFRFSISIQPLSFSPGNQDLDGLFFMI